MPVRGALERYLVTEGSSLKLDEIDQQEKQLFQHGGKDEHMPFFDQLRDE
ncbi:MAG: hypothetical protein GWO24_17455, partial [Akkermansiaceae bacterium]|nr:hypothetical protein [Akkermansiaceae bacterium]